MPYLITTVRAELPGLAGLRTQSSCPSAGGPVPLTACCRDTRSKPPSASTATKCRPPGDCPTSYAAVRGRAAPGGPPVGEPTPAGGGGGGGAPGGEAPLSRELAYSHRMARGAR